MTKIMFYAVLLGAISLSGCSGFNYKETTCTVKYEIKTFPSSGWYRLNVNAVRYDRFGRMSVRIARGQGINFFNPWLSSGFVNEDCK